MLKGVNQNIIKQIYENWLEYLILASVLYIAYFYHLGTPNIRIWDEGIYGSNVLEMLHRKDFLVKYFNGYFETYAAIPPFVAWFQVLSFSIFGISEFTFRLPSAISAIIISITIFYFLYKEFNDKYWGLFSALILAFSNGFVAFHVARTGDLDVFVTLFSTLYILAFYKFYKSDFKSKKYAILFVLFIFCAFWSKLIAGFFYLPVIFIFVLFSGKTKAFFKNKWLYISGSTLLVITSLYYFYMETKVPGYTNIVVQNGIIGRYTGKLMDNHLEPFWFYWKNIKSINFIPWLYLLPFSIFLLFKDKHLEKNKFIIFLLSLVLFYWLVISLSANKIVWYDAQLYPILSIIAAYSFSFIFNLIINSGKANHLYRQLVFLTFFVAFMGNQFFEREKNNRVGLNFYSVDESYGTVLKNIHEKFPDIKKISIVYPLASPIPSPHVTYYRTLYNLFYDYKINDEKYKNENDIYIIPYSYIIYGYPMITDKLKKYYDFETLYEYNDIKLVHVKNRVPYIKSVYLIDGDSLPKNSALFSNEKKTTGVASIKINKQHQYSEGFSEEINDLIYEQYSKIKISADILMKEKVFNSYLVIDSKDQNYWNGIDLSSLIKKANKWYKLDTIIELPKFENPKNSILKLYFWNNNNDDLFIDNVKINLIKNEYSI